MEVFNFYISILLFALFFVLHELDGKKAPFYISIYAFGFVVIDYPVLLSPAKIILLGGEMRLIMNVNLFEINLQGEL